MLLLKHKLTGLSLYNKIVIYFMIELDLDFVMTSYGTDIVSTVE